MDLQERASEWVVKNTSGNEEELKTWLQNSEFARRYRDTAQAWDDLGTMGKSREFAYLLGQPTWRERLVERCRSVKNALLHPAAYVTLAAALIIGLVTLYSGHYGGQQQIYQTQIGEVREIQLPDDSTVTLDAHSQIHIDFKPDLRHLKLTRGRAFFAVRKDAQRPFIVETKDTQVRVVGTQFEVYNGPEHVKVAVTEGVVDVSKVAVDAANGGPPQRIAGKSVSAGQEVISADEIVFTQGSASVRAGSWRSGRLTYDNASLVEVIADANRYYRGHIVLASDDLRSLKVTTAFRAEQIDKMLESLTTALPLEVLRQANGDVLIRRRQ